MNSAGDNVPELEVEALHERLKTGAPPQVVDVREPWEWARGHITGAIHIPLQELPARLGEVDPAQDIAFICHLGGRSEMATRFSRQHGFEHACNVPGGMDAWEKRGFPVES